MKEHNKYMNQCLELAKNGMSNVSPNPMVGCVIVCENQIIGQGYHERFGEAHAEMNAINDVTNKELLKDSTLYVNLEPCAHHGKTPPCADLIIANKIPRVVIGTLDTYSEVAGKGMEKLIEAGIDVTVGVMEGKCLDLNKRFFTFHEKKRPYIILKWAQTGDGFIDVDRTVGPAPYNWITSPESKTLVHQWRAEEAAILIGKNTAMNDDPGLTVREVEGRHPVRVVLDSNLDIPKNLQLFDGTAHTLVFNTQKEEDTSGVSYIKVESTRNLNDLMDVLYKKNLSSVIIEGGTQVIQSFLNQGLWDEARVFTGMKEWGKGLKAPEMNFPIRSELYYGMDKLSVYING